MRPKSLSCSPQTLSAALSSTSARRLSRAGSVVGVAALQSATYSVHAASRTAASALSNFSRTASTTAISLFVAMLHSTRRADYSGAVVISPSCFGGAWGGAAAAGDWDVS